METSELHCIVSGRVQMVMFRDFATRAARKGCLTGFVRNCSDGTVEIVAQGPTADLEKLLSRVRHGSLLSRVDDVRAEWRKPREIFDRFHLER